MKKYKMIWVLGVALLVSILKLINLKSVPLFGDEAAYCYWGYKIANQGLLKAWSEMVNQGKIAPVVPIIQAIGFLIFTKLSPLLVCRSTSVILSGLTGIMVFLLAGKIDKDKKLAWAALLFYLLNPFEFFNSRTSLLEPGLNLMAILAVFLVYQKKLVKGAILLMASTLTKLTGFLIAPGLILMTKRKHWFLMGLSSVAVFAAVFYLTGLWSTFEYHSYSGLNFGAMIKRTWSNFLLAKSWYSQYLHLGFWLVAVLGAWQSIKQKQYMWLIFIVTILAPYILLADSFFPRFLLLTLPFWAIVIGFGVKKKVGVIVLAVLLGVYLRQDYLIISQPESASIAREDKFQFFEDWSSGAGVPVVIEYVDKNYKGAKVFMPQDLYHRFFIYGLGMKIKQQYIYDFENLDLVGNVFVSTSHDFRLKGALDKKYTLEKVFASNGEQANSMILYEIRSQL